ncbi:MAG: hypothetical protein GW778_06330 [Alphaproteobacteria bacterium]|nr:hypothetical protein [Alphaproteobacteria bacterium]
MSKNWTPERREAQRQRCLKNKPWAQSTGPKTSAGKARVAMNAYKYGGDGLYKKLITEMLHHNREFVKHAVELEEIKLIKAMEKQSRIGGIVPNPPKTK